MLDDFRTHRKHLDSAQKRVLPTSKTAAPGKASKAGHLKGDGAPLALCSPFASIEETLQPVWQSFDTKNSSTSDEQQAGV